MEVITSVAKNTHELKVGDLLQHYGAILRLMTRTEYHNEKQPDNPTIQFSTECLHLEENATMPKEWAYREGGFTIQGNRLAYWNAVTVK